MPESDRTELFVRLILANQRRVYGLIASMVGNLTDADDLLQEVSAAMWRKFDQYQPGTDFGAWAMKFARLEVLKFYERSRASKLRFAPDLLETIGDDVEAMGHQIDSRHEALQTCLTKLDERARLIVRLRYEPGATVASVAASLDVSANVIYKSLNTIHSLLLACIQRTLALEETA